MSDAQVIQVSTNPLENGAANPGGNGSENLDQHSDQKSLGAFSARGSLLQRLYANRFRWLIILALGALFFSSEELRHVVRDSMSDAFLAVTAFVAATLALVFFIESSFSFSLGELMRKNLRWQPLIASALGILPGCGGAIVVVTQFTKGYASFGAFIAVLVSTMGDAAILLVVRDPTSALIVLSLSFVAGTITGQIVDLIHGRDFMAIDQDAVKEADPNAKLVTPGDLPAVQLVWGVIIAIGLVLGLLLAIQFEPDTWLGSFGELEPTPWFGFSGAVMCLVMWAFSRQPDGHHFGVDTLSDDPIVPRIIKDTNFVTAWVILAFLIYEVAVVLFGLDLGKLFEGIALLLPLVAILIGFIPGCGPQILVTSLYLAGAVPMSAQIANAIANDGDALFPALALAPKAAILATLYSAVPALIIGYGWYFLIGT